MKGGKGLNDYKFVTFIGLFRSDGAASMTVNGLNAELSKLTNIESPLVVTGHNMLKHYLYYIIRITSFQQGILTSYKYKLLQKPRTSKVLHACKTVTDHCAPVSPVGRAFAVFPGLPRLLTAGHHQTQQHTHHAHFL